MNPSRGPVEERPGDGEIPHLGEEPPKECLNNYKNLKVGYFTIGYAYYCQFRSAVSKASKSAELQTVGLILFLVNPLSRNIQIQILQTDLHTFP